MKNLTIWSLILALPVIAAAYTAAEALGLDLPRPAWKNELVEVDARLLTVGADVLTIWEDRLINLQIQKLKLQEAGQPVPESILREIEQLKRRIAKRKKELGL